MKKLSERAAYAHVLDCVERLPVKKLIDLDYYDGKLSCAIGALGFDEMGSHSFELQRSRDLRIPTRVHAAVIQENDDGGPSRESATARYKRMTRWLKEKAATPLEPLPEPAKEPVLA